MKEGDQTVWIACLVLVKKHRSEPKDFNEEPKFDAPKARLVAINPMHQIGPNHAGVLDFSALQWREPWML